MIRGIMLLMGRFDISVSFGIDSRQMSLDLQVYLAKVTSKIKVLKIERVVMVSCRE